METFEGKVVLVTGGTSGIGRATAIAFATQGIRVNAICPGIVETQMTAGPGRSDSRGASDRTLWQSGGNRRGRALPLFAGSGLRDGYLVARGRRIHRRLNA